MFITAIHSRFEKKLDFVENVIIHGRNLNKKIRSEMFKAMHHYMGLSVNNYSQSFEGNLEAFIKIYNEIILDLVDLI